MPDIVLATSNPHKIDELRAIFGRSGLEGVRLLGLGDARTAGALREPAETGRTFEENATIKAVSYAEQTGCICLADDSGLEIDALGGRPGVISSHYSTDGRETGLSRAERDAANNAKVLKELERVPEAARTARFVCVMVLAKPLKAAQQGQDWRDARPTAHQGAPAVLAMTRGTFEGRIGMAGPASQAGVPRGANGFGYDPLFLVAPDFVHTSAELPTEEKNRLSHRAASARAMADRLRGLA